MMTHHPEELARFVFYAVILAWIAFAALFIFFKQPAKGTNNARDRFSMLGLLLQMAGYFFVWFFQRPLLAAVIPMPAVAQIFLAILTVAIAFGSVWFCLQAIRALGKQWALQARVVEGHELIMAGPYAVVRNPIYLGMFGLLVSTGLAVSTWQGLLLGVILFLLGNEIRIRSEERLLRSAFGEKFYDYARRVPAFFPKLF